MGEWHSQVVRMAAFWLTICGEPLLFIFKLACCHKAVIKLPCNIALFPELHSRPMIVSAKH